MAEHTAQTVEGLWNALGSMEASARNQLRQKLQPFASSFRDCYEAGVQTAILKSDRHQELHIKTAALFLKRTLNDLRSVWLLNCFGYTSQAASVAASLFENALATTVIAKDPSNSASFLSGPSGDLSWSPIQLSNMRAELIRQDKLRENKSFSEDDYETAWRHAYGGYKWLCKVKHPTLPSVLHDSFSTQCADDQFVVMAAPDVRDDNLPVKATICLISLSRSASAIADFACSLSCDSRQSDYQSFLRRLGSVLASGREAYKQLSQSPLPFTIYNTPFAQETRAKKFQKNSK